MVQVLLGYRIDVNVQNNNGTTPLAYATYDDFKDPRVVRLLLDHGADLNTPRSDRTTPLHHASRLGRIGIAHLLLEHGSSVEVKDRRPIGRCVRGAARRDYKITVRALFQVRVQCSTDLLDYPNVLSYDKNPASLVVSCDAMRDDTWTVAVISFWGSLRRQYLKLEA
jgi:hypothetical protein